MAGTLKKTTLLLGILTAVLWGAYARWGSGLCLSLTITAATFFYHLAMRLLVGAAADGILHNRVNPRGPWFRQRPWEPGLWRLLRVRKWKGKLPTYDPELFDRKHRSPEEIAGAMCQAEIVHEIIAVLSFLPLLAVRYVGALPVFVITGLVAAAFDLSFAVIQRFNRPRLLRILEKQRQRGA